VNYNAAVSNFGDNAQTGGSRDVYHGPVDKSQNKTSYGDHAQVGGVRVTKTNSRFIHLFLHSIL